MSKVTDQSLGLTRDTTVSSLGLKGIPSGSQSKKSSDRREINLKRYGKWIEIDPYDDAFLCITDKKKFQALYVRLTGEANENLDTCRGLVCSLFLVNEGFTLNIMYLPTKFEEVTVWHEALHLTHDVLAGVGVTVGADASSSESQAYMQGYIVSLIKKHVYPKPKRKKAPKKEA